jgi:hypothetical protein
MQQTMQVANAGPAAWWGPGVPQPPASWWDASHTRGGPHWSDPHADGSASTVFPCLSMFPGWQLPSPPPPGAGETMFVSLNVLTPTSHGACCTSWMIDSGASVHPVNDLSLLHNPVMHAQPLPLHLATSDAKGGIIASGSVCLVNAR